MFSHLQVHLQSHLALLIALVVTSIGNAQAVPSKTDVSAGWKTAQLVQLADRASAMDLKETARDEITAQQTWLKNWTPGGMQAKARAVLVSERRKEPLLQSKRADVIRKRLSTNSGNDSAPIELTAQQNADLAVLKKACAEHPNDIALQQLNLHWMDEPTRRKTSLMEIDSAANRLIQSLKSFENDDATLRLANEFAMYRRARALAYRELPEVMEKTPIEDPKNLDQQIHLAFQELIESTGKGRPEFILLEIRMLRREKHFGSALGLLEKYGSAISSKWYLKKRRDLLKELNWEFPYREAATIYANEFPQEVAKETAQQNERQSLSEHDQ